MSKTGTTASKEDQTSRTEHGPLTQRVMAYDRAMQGLLAHAKTPEDWAPLTEFVDTEKFRRVGVFREVHGWKEYLEMLSQWAGATNTFETELLHCTETGDMVFYEIQESHHRWRGEAVVDIVNSMTAFTFDGQGRIVALRVYLQREPGRKG